MSRRIHARLRACACERAKAPGSQTRYHAHARTHMHPCAQRTRMHTRVLLARACVHLESLRLRPSRAHVLDLTLQRLDLCTYRHGRRHVCRDLRRYTHTHSTSWVQHLDLCASRHGRRHVYRSACRHRGMYSTSLDQRQSQRIDLCVRARAHACARACVRACLPACTRVPAAPACPAYLRTGSSPWSSVRSIRARLRARSSSSRCHATVCLETRIDPCGDLHDESGAVSVRARARQMTQLQERIQSPRMRACMLRA